MSESGTEKAFFGPMKRKVIAAFVLACLAIGFALVITYFSFSGLLDTVDQLSSPNDKLRTLNNLFQEVTRLDQKQRVDAIRNPNKTYREFISESKRIVSIIDTLRAMEWENQQQLDRLSGIEEILRRRNGLLLSYLRLKSDFVYNRKFSTQLDSLTAILSQSALGADSSVTTTEKKTTTTTYVPQATDDRTFLGKLFGKKKKEEPADTRIEVKEELSVKVDTLAIAQQDSAIQQVGRIMRSLEEDQRTQNRKMIQRELELMNTNTVLINQMLATLHEVEGEEMHLINANNERAADLVSDAVRKIAIVMVIFFLVAAVLVFLTLTDITRSNYYRKQLIEARDHAEELGVVKQRFLANMSHEIRTPLQSILGFAEQIRHGGENKEAVEAIQASSEHLLHIVNEVLDFSRLESGKVMLEYEPFDLFIVVKEVEDNIRVQAQKKNLAFRVDTSGAKAGVFMGDAFRLRQVLYNLLGNAIKFTNSGEVKLVLTVKEDESGTAQCIFQVVDTGIGMNREDVDRVFQQFEQANVGVTRQYGGTGLGLSIVKRIVEAQNGTITVDSEVGNGSVFTVELFFDHAPDASIVPETSTTHPVRKFSGKALVVDDDPLILRLCSIIFEKNNIPFVAMNEADKVLETELDPSVNLILLDIRMPHVNGVELCQGLRRRYGNKVTIIALTAHVLEDERDDLLSHGFDEVLSKPFREQDLLGILGIVPNETNHIQSVDDTQLDLTALRNLTMGDEALMQSILEQFLDETHQDVVALEMNITNLDAKAVREIIHKLSGRVGQLGVQGLSKRLRQIEESLDGGSGLSPILEKIYTAQDDVKLLLTEVQEQVLSGKTER